MNYRNQKYVLSTAIISTILLASACTNGSGTKTGNDEPSLTPTPVKATAAPLVTKDPVELLVYGVNAYGDSTVFMDRFGKIITDKYPNFTIKFINWKDIPNDQLPIQNPKIDLYVGAYDSYLTMIDMGYADLDLSELIKKFKFDITRINPTLLDSFTRNNKGKINAMPYQVISHTLTYNKEIFDRLGEPYLKDGMTWDEVYQVAKRLTRLEGGTQYQGFQHQQLKDLLSFNQYGQHMVDIKTGKASLNTGKWPELFKVYSAFFNIPGNNYEASAANVLNTFIKDRRLAMMVNFSSQFGTLNFMPADLNFDLVKLPSFPDIPGVGAGGQPLYFAISPTSQHKEEAFAFMAELLSDNFQAVGARKGQAPAVQLKDLDKIFYADIPVMKGKNIKGAIVEKYAPAADTTFNGVVMSTFAYEAFGYVADQKKDINTALRDADEAANKKLEEIKLTKK